MQNKEDWLKWRFQTIITQAIWGLQDLGVLEGKDGFEILQKLKKVMKEIKD